MIKKIALFMLALLPLGAMAQTQKIGHVNTSELISLMPELEAINKEYQAKQDEWKTQIEKSRDEYFTKIKEFQDSQATMSESIKQARQAELANMEQQINTLQQTAGDDLGKTQEKLVAPIREKISKAISEVAQENGFTYIFDLASQAQVQFIAYISPSATDITSLVKKKLNLGEKPKAPAANSGAKTTTTGGKK